MKIATAELIFEHLNGYTREINNDFDENDQFYLRVYLKNRQFLIKGISRYFKIIEVGLNGGIGYKTLLDNVWITDIKTHLKLIK